MKVRVQFFAQLRDVMRASELELEMEASATVNDLLGKLYFQTPTLRAWNDRILIGAGVEFVDRSYILQSDDQIAIMPPVQGG